MKRASLRAVLARRLREVAAEQGVALTHVADRAGVGRSHLWRLLNADASATLDAVEKLAEALNVDPIVLLSDRVEPSSLKPSARPAKPTALRAAAERRKGPPRSPGGR